MKKNWTLILPPSPLPNLADVQNSTNKHQQAIHLSFLSQPLEWLHLSLIWLDKQSTDLKARFLMTYIKNMHSKKRLPEDK